MKAKRGIAAALAGALLLTGLAGCGSKDSAGSGSGETDAGQIVNQAADNVKAVDSFTLAYNENDGFDPLSCTSSENQLIAQLCFESLFVLDDNFQPQKVLCDSLEQTGSRAYTLKLRSGAKFHSGQEVTPADVVFSLNNARLREDSIYQDQLSCISSVKYSGDEVHIRLYRENSNLAALLDVPILRKGTDEDECPDGSGPYQLVTSDGKKCLIPFEQRTGGKVGFCESITLVSVSDATGAANLLSSGELSMLMQTDAEQSPAQGGKYTASVPTTRLHYLGVNCDMEPYDNEDVRTALSLLLDRESIVQTCFAGRADAASLPIVPVPDDVDAPEYNKEKALELLEDADIYDRNDDGFLDISRSRQFKVEIIYNEKYSTKGAVLQQYAETLTEAGILTEVKPLTFEECQSKLRNESFQLYYGEYTMTADFDLSSLISSNGERNFSGYYDSDMEDAINGLASYEEGEEEDARKEYAECFAEQTPFIPIAFERTLISSASELPKQFAPWPDQIFHGIETWSAS